MTLHKFYIFFPYIILKKEWHFKYVFPELYYIYINPKIVERTKLLGKIYKSLEYEGKTGILFILVNTVFYCYISFHIHFAQKKTEQQK